MTTMMTTIKYICNKHTLNSGCAAEQLRYTQTTRSFQCNKALVMVGLFYTKYTIHGLIKNHF